MRASLFTAIALLASLLTSPLVLADEGGDSYQDNRIDALHYRSGANQFLVGLDFSTTLHDNETVTSNGSATSAYSRSHFESTAEFAWGITDRWTVGISESDLLSRSDSQTYISGGQNFTYHASGLSDPTLRGNYRFMGDLTGDHFGNAFVDLTPALGQNQDAETGRNGNNLAVATELTGGVDFFWVKDAHEFQVEGAIHYFTSGSEQDQDPNYTISENARMTYTVDGIYRFHFMDNFYAEAQVGIQLPNTIQSSNAFGSYKIDYSTIITPVLEVGWRPIPSLLTYVSFAYDSYTGTGSTLSGSVNAQDVAYVTTTGTIGAAWKF